MKTEKRLFFILTLLIISTTSLSTGFTEDSTTSNLPEGAKARFGKGQISDLTYSPDGIVWRWLRLSGFGYTMPRTGEELDVYLDPTTRSKMLHILLMEP